MRDTYKLEKFDYSDRTVLEDVIDAVHDPKSPESAHQWTGSQRQSQSAHELNFCEV